MAKEFNAREITIALEKSMVDDFGLTALAITRNLIFGSPVGNPDLWQDPDAAPPGYVGGHFRRNWVVSVGGFDEAEVEGEDASGASTMAEAQGVLDTYRKRVKLGPNLVIQNNVAYANRLANGWSLQAEAGWVDEAIELGLDKPGGREELP